MRARRAAASAAVLVLALAGCGGSDVDGGGTVALQAADGGPGTTGKDGADGASTGGDGGDGGDATSGELASCMARNDDVVPWREQDVSKSTGWHRQHRQEAHVRIIQRVHLRLGDAQKLPPEVSLRAGFLGYDLDPVGNRLIMMIDPTRIDHAEFRRWVHGVARQANKAANVRGKRLTVTVQDGCYPAAEYEQLWSTLRTDGRASSLSGGVRLDGTLHATFCGEADVAYAKQMQERFPMLSYVTECLEQA